MRRKLAVMDANQENNIGMHSDGVSGKVIYKINDDLCESEMVFAKFVSTEDQAHTYRPLVHPTLIPTFLHYNRRSQQGDTIAVLSRHFGPQWMGNNFKSVLDYAHLSLMPLQQKGQNVEAVPRLEKLVRNFKDYVCQSFTCSPEDQYYVLGHRSFNQSNVLFFYVDHRPVDIKIMDWQSGFVSLGMDLICLLYADASQQTRNECWNQLLDNYYSSLKTTFDDNVVPSKDQIPKEMKISRFSRENLLKNGWCSYPSCDVPGE
ncbi:hypothetical protein V9T40_014654 [Parthenolecanium corni]|uniref:CHK kinase-like domain-containing protein n=1 Tax=Parthenolecanium corni TaxID=536013 RepID=A0AAN9T5A8_9HEMI